MTYQSIPVKSGGLHVKPVATCQDFRDLHHFGTDFWSRSGVANLFGKRAKFMIKEVHRAKSWFKGNLAGQVFSSFTANLCANCLSELVKKSPWAISKALAGKKWPAGPALATPGLYRPEVPNLFGK
jgi:hypothetical protein